jgi:hypothetical protein
VITAGSAARPRKALRKPNWWGLPGAGDGPAADDGVDVAGQASAAGIVAAEVSLDQPLAGTAMELFVAEVAAGATVGAAMRAMR